MQIKHMRFSKKENIDLLKSWAALTLAFTIMFGALQALDRFLFLFITSAVTVGLGFLLHELAHKYVAQRYGCWAEFRSDDKMLIFAIALSFMGYIFAAPGAVYVHGHLSSDKNGKIAIAGPITNIILAFFFLFLLALTKSLPTSSIPPSLIFAFWYGFRINAWLAVFNMLPFFTLDGEKVLAWNKLYYGITLGIALILMFLQGIIIV